MEKDFRKYLEASQAYLGSVDGFREAMIQAMEKQEREMENLAALVEDLRGKIYEWGVQIHDPKATKGR